MDNKLVRPGLLLASGLILASLVACSSAPAGNQSTPNANRGAVATSNQTTATGANRGNAATVPTSAAAAKTVDIAAHITADGRLSFATERGLTFGTSGQVAQVNVNELDKVAKGQVLARLDTTSLDRAVKAAEIALKAADLTVISAEIDRQLAEYGVKSTEADLKQVQDNVKTAGIDLQTATNSLAKISYPYTYTSFSIDIPAAIVSIYGAQLSLNQAAADLQPGTPNYANALARFNTAQNNLTAALQQLGKGVNLDALVTSVSQSKAGVATTSLAWATTDIWTITAAQLAVDKAQMSVTSAQNAVNKTGLTLDNSRSQLSKAQIALDKTRNDVDRARNDLDKARDDRDKATITALFDGVIAAVNVKVGDTLTSGSYATTVAIDLVDPSRMELDFDVNELDIPGVKLGQKVTISVSALPKERFEGVVTSISSLPSVQAGVVSYLVKTVFSVPGNSPLKAGMGATADITVQ